MNEIHRKFNETYTINRINDLWKILDNLPDGDREAFLSPLYIQILRVEFDTKDENKTIGEMIADEDSYENFKSKIIEMFNMSICELFIVRSLVGYVLIHYYDQSDDSVEKYNKALDRYGKLQEYCVEQGERELWNKSKKTMDNYFDTKKEQGEKYNMICDKIVLPLLRVDSFENI